MIKEFDWVKLKSGEVAIIMDVLESGKMYIADIGLGEKARNDFLPHENIEKIISCAEAQTMI